MAPLTRRSLLESAALAPALALATRGSAAGSGESAAREQVETPTEAGGRVEPPIAVAARIPAYRAACVQMRVLPTLGRGGFLPAALARNVGRCVESIARGATEVDARLYVFSEFCLQLANFSPSVEAWLSSAISIPGPETDRIARAAQSARAYVALNVVERIARFPDRYFLSGVLIGASGDILLNYRKLYDLTNKTRPTDFLHTWLEHFGPDSLFPVADTAIGRIGCAVALDVNWPELVRGLVFKGAEIIVNPTASPLAAPGYAVPEADPAADIRTMVRRVRAFENLAYVLCCNLGPVGADEGAPLTPMLPSQIVDYRGHVLASSRDAGEGFITATLDVEALRRARCTPDALNTLAQLQTALHAPGYAAAEFARIDGFETQPIRDRSEQTARLGADIESLVRRDVFRAPKGEAQ